MGRCSIWEIDEEPWERKKEKGIHNETDVREQILKRGMQHISGDKHFISTSGGFHGWVVTPSALNRFRGGRGERL